MAQTLEELIPQYAANKKELDSYKKICDKENAQIKLLMAKLPDNVCIVGKYKATYTVSNRETINEEQLIDLFMNDPDFIKINEQYNVVEMRPAIDFDELERAIYKGAFSKDQTKLLNAAKTSKEVVTLRISEIKEEN